MSEFFLELFSEEIPVNLQKNAREALLQNFKDFFEKKINFCLKKKYKKECMVKRNFFKSSESLSV